MLANKMKVGGNKLFFFVDCMPFFGASNENSKYGSCIFVR